MLQLKSLEIQLETLRSSLDEAILHGSSFAEVKKIYLQIKEVKQLIEKRKQQLEQHQQ